MNHLGEAKKDNVLGSWYWLGSFLFEVWLKIILFPVGGEENWRRAFLGFINPQSSDKIIELCCGTGKITKEMAKQVIQNRIAAIDLSPNLIRISEKKAAKEDA